MIPGVEKFQEDLEKKTVADLKAYAEEYEVDLTGARLKAEIVAAIVGDYDRIFTPIINEPQGNDVEEVFVDQPEEDGEVLEQYKDFPAWEELEEETKALAAAEEDGAEGDPVEEVNEDQPDQVDPLTGETIALEDAGIPTPITTESVADYEDHGSLSEAQVAKLPTHMPKEGVEVDANVIWPTDPDGESTPVYMVEITSPVGTRTLAYLWDDESESWYMPSEGQRENELTPNMLKRMPFYQETDEVKVTEEITWASPLLHDAPNVPILTVNLVTENTGELYQYNWNYEIEDWLRLAKSGEVIEPPELTKRQAEFLPKGARPYIGWLNGKKTLRALSEDGSEVYDWNYTSLRWQISEVDFYRGLGIPDPPGGTLAEAVRLHGTNLIKYVDAATGEAYQCDISHPSPNWMRMLPEGEFPGMEDVHADQPPASVRVQRIRDSQKK